MSVWMDDDRREHSTPRLKGPRFAPLYAATPLEALGRFFTKYAVFGGRASRSEYWWVALIFSVPSVILYLVVQVAGREVSLATLQAIFVVALIIGVATIIPTFALTVRRLHDANFSGLFLLFGLIPFIGGLIVTILLLLPDREEGSRFDW